jgi:hypothetical protein
LARKTEKAIAKPHRPGLNLDRRFDRGFLGDIAVTTGRRLRIIFVLHPPRRSTNVGTLGIQIDETGFSC